MIIKKIFQHAVKVNGVFYRAGEEVKIDEGVKEKTPKKKETALTK